MFVTKGKIADLPTKLNNNTSNIGYNIKMNKYLNIFNLALDAYQNQDKRPGYKPGWFSSLRHSFSLYPQIKQLQDALTAEENDGKAKLLVDAHFKSKKTSFNNHSFSRYFLDALETTYPDENWRALDPQPLIFYHPANDARLYRGTALPPHEAFKTGITDASPAEKIEHYAATSNLSTGVSTTKQRHIATSYAASLWLHPTAKGMIFKATGPVYVYEIHYRDGLGIDILETTKARKSNFIRKTDANSKEEVNIAGKIAPEDIVGAWEILPGSEKRIENPHYNAEKKAPTLTTPEKLQTIFSLR